MLKPQLNAEEREHLKALEGKWPYYARLVLELSEKHPLKLPGPATGPIKHNELPKEYQAVLPTPANVGKAHREALKSGNGKWPEYAIAVTEIVRPKNPTLTPLGPSKPADFAAPVKLFIEKDLLPMLTVKEKDDLQKTEGRWPEYPRTLLELAGKHGLEVPQMRLPNAADWWEKVGNALPEVPDRVLRDFALNDLSVEERGKLQLSVGDPASRDRLVQEYFKKNPNELKRLQHLDHQLLLNGVRPPKTKPGA